MLAKMDAESISSDGIDKPACAMSTYCLDLMLKRSSLLTGMIAVSSELCNRASLNIFCRKKELLLCGVRRNVSVTFFILTFFSVIRPCRQRHLQKKDPKNVKYMRHKDWPQERPNSNFVSGKTKNRKHST